MPVAVFSSMYFYAHLKWLHIEKTCSKKFLCSLEVFFCFLSFCLIWIITGRWKHLFRISSDVVETFHLHEQLAVSALRGEEGGEEDRRWTRRWRRGRRSRRRRWRKIQKEKEEDEEGEGEKGEDSSSSSSSCFRKIKKASHRSTQAWCNLSHISTWKKTKKSYFHCVVFIFSLF